MARIRTVLLLTFILLVSTAYQPLHVQGHTPGPLTLEYDFETEILTASVTHVTENINTHYIYQIVVEKNSIQYTTRSYTNQSSISGMSDTFNVSSTAGDILRVTAKCIVSGQVSGQITVTGTGATANTDAPLPMTEIILVVVIMLAVVGVIIVLLRKQ